MDYTTLSVSEVSRGLDDLARDVHSTFSGLDGRQLNWQPDQARWSVAQCFEHLLTANRLMMANAEEALRGGQTRTIWQRAPVLPRVFGRLLIRSQAPGTARKFTAPAIARPASSDIAADVIGRFVEQQRDAAARMLTTAEREAARAVMTSPFARVVTYSVLDGWRLILAHGWRHVEQARRVTLLPEFPRA